MLQKDRAAIFFQRPERHGYLFDLPSEIAYDTHGLLIPTFRESFMGSGTAASERIRFI
ncbi:MAG: hypothetical protein KQI81_07495 [Deltaproteobacteria bacterium]|nr:hypothetical protein [Deltaproteobacteria bacterium]